MPPLHKPHVLVYPSQQIPEQVQSTTATRTAPPASAINLALVPSTRTRTAAAAFCAAGLRAFDALALAKGTRVVLVTNATAALPVPVPALVGDAACGCAACGWRYDGAAVWRSGEDEDDVDEDADGDGDEDREEEAATAAAAVVLGGGGRGIEPAALTALSAVGCAVCGGDAGGALRLLLGAFARIGAGWNESDGGGGGEGEGEGGVEGEAKAAWRVGGGQMARGHTELLAEPPPSALAMALTGMGFASGARIGVSE